MAMTAVILRDIQLAPDGPIYRRQFSAIEYDPNRAVTQKRHRLVSQETDSSGGTVVYEAYITHSTLMRLVAGGDVQIKEEKEKKKKGRARKPSLAEILYEAWRQEFDGITAPWNVVTPKERKQWEAVAIAAEEWAYDNVRGEE